MLILTRDVQEGLVIDDNVTITLLREAAFKKIPFLGV